MAAVLDAGIGLRTRLVDFIGQVAYFNQLIKELY